MSRVIVVGLVTYGSTSRYCYELRKGLERNFYLTIIDKFSNTKEIHFYEDETLARNAIQTLWEEEKQR